MVERRAAALGHIAQEVEHSGAEGGPLPSPELGLRIPKQGFEGRQVMVLAQGGLEGAQVVQHGFGRCGKGAFQGFDGVAQLLDPDPRLVQRRGVLVGGQRSQFSQGGRRTGFQAGPGGFLERGGLEGPLKRGHLQEAVEVRQRQLVQRLVHGAAGLGAAAVHLFLQVLEDGGLGGRVDVEVAGSQKRGMDIQLPGQAEGVHQPLQGPALPLVARVIAGIHQVQHSPQAARRDAHLVELLHILGPRTGLEQVLQTRQADLEGAMKQDRQLRWMHQTILDTVR